MYKLDGHVKVGEDELQATLDLATFGIRHGMWKQVDMEIQSQTESKVVSERVGTQNKEPSNLVDSVYYRMFYIQRVGSRNLLI